MRGRFDVTLQKSEKISEKKINLKSEKNKSGMGAMLCHSRLTLAYNYFQATQPCTEEPFNNPS